MTGGNGTGSGDRSGVHLLPEGRPGVLIVDDAVANLVALEALLGELDCDVVRASSGNEALRQLLRRPFAVLLLDVQMPEMDGYEVARYARDNPATRDVPIIFVTAMHETEDTVFRSYASGAIDLLFKPVNPYILRSKVQVFLDLYLSRRRLAEEIEAHKKTAAELEAFSYSVSHDLRAPLRPLAGFSEVLLEDYGDQLDARAQDFLRRIRAAAQRMGHLIEDLLELARMGRAELRRQTVDLSALVESIAGELRAAEPVREVELKIDEVGDVRGDAQLLRVALENLLRNAWKFTGRRAGGACIEFGRLAAAPGSGEPAFFVRDNGAGFDPTYAGKLFQPFQRLHATSDFEGSGIGLAIVDRIIRRHRGRVWAEAAPDQGATFFFTLPQ